MQVQLIKKSTQSNKYKHEEATKTILILALVYIIFNIPYCTVYVLRSLTLWSNSKIRPILGSMSLPVRYLVYSFILTHTMALNSTVNPLIYFCRLPQLRKFVLQKEGLRESISKSLRIKTRKVSCSMVFWWQSNKHEGSKFAIFIDCDLFISTNQRTNWIKKEKLTASVQSNF